MMVIEHDLPPFAVEGLMTASGKDSRQERLEPKELLGLQLSEMEVWWLTSTSAEWPAKKWVGWGIAVLVERGWLAGDMSFGALRLHALINNGHATKHGREYLYDDSTVNVAKFKLSKEVGGWEAVRDWFFSTHESKAVRDWFAGDNEIDQRLEHILTRVGEETATVAATEFHHALGQKLFAGSLLRFLPFAGVYDFRSDDVATYFDPPDFPTLRDWDPVYQRIIDDLDPDLKTVIADHLDGIRESYDGDKFVPPPGVGPDWRPLGSNALRTVLRDVHEENDDHMGWPEETRIRPLTVAFAPTDWHRIQGFSNRLGRDDEFRQKALAPETNWVRSALPPNQNGRVPSFVATHGVITGGSGDDSYLVLAQRTKTPHYFPLHWETLAENFMGPRKVMRENNAIADGDASLHECLMRGIAEEFGLQGRDLRGYDVTMLGFFVEAPFASMVALFWAHTNVAFPVIEQRMRKRVAEAREKRVPLEAIVVAREPNTTSNLVRLVMAPAAARLGLSGGTYAPTRDAEGRDFFVLENQTDELWGFHPATSARILLYLLADEERHPREQLVQAFEAEFARLNIPLL